MLNKVKQKSKQRFKLAERMLSGVEVEAAKRGALRLNKTYYIYILQCSNSYFYTGATSDLSRRVYEHEIGADRTAYTYSRRPVKLLWAQECSTKEEALQLEHQIKGWSRAKKEALIQNDYGKVHEIVKRERVRREQKKKATPIFPEQMLSKGASTTPSLRSGSALRDELCEAEVESPEQMLSKGEAIVGEQLPPVSTAVAIASVRISAGAPSTQRPERMLNKVKQKSKGVLGDIS